MFLEWRALCLCISCMLARLVCTLDEDPFSLNKASLHPDLPASQLRSNAFSFCYRAVIFWHALLHLQPGAAQTNDEIAAIR